ncbi:MAG: hypothetical protein BWZ07_02401 [Alphaproteobacteria bacterium ADurb.BinA280]|nr:MAG: hypothetical protein BWZ07_02401 [Alphaproteobacteria bacterium ADurb.BinA280]
MLRQCEASIAVARGANRPDERCVEAAIGGETLYAHRRVTVRGSVRAVTSQHNAAVRLRSNGQDIGVATGNDREIGNPPGTARKTCGGRGVVKRTGHGFDTMRRVENECGQRCGYGQRGRVVAAHANRYEAG